MGRHAFLGRKYLSCTYSAHKKLASFLTTTTNFVVSFDGSSTMAGVAATNHRAQLIYWSAAVLI
eukprot:scaffold9944_cov93-Cylindrotheca_fusiformis.AAC.2